MPQEKKLFTPLKTYGELIETLQSPKCTGLRLFIASAELFPLEPNEAAKGICSVEIDIERFLLLHGSRYVPETPMNAVIYPDGITTIFPLQD